MAGLKFALPWVQGRGAGLGNELVPWCRAFLAAQVVGATCLPPAFGLNMRRYGRHFGTPKLDWLLHRALRGALPRVHFGEADYLEHGGGDVVQALTRFSAARGLAQRSALVLTTDGMWGGFPHIEAARDFALSTLYRSRFAAGNLVRIRQRLDPGLPVVGVHVRLGDFGSAVAPEEYRARFNVALPFDWYREVVRQLHERMQGQVQFLVVSDASAERLQPLTQGLRCVFTSDLPDSDCSDLLALARTDLLVCSVSSYSAWAAFLSDAPYLWYGPNLTPHDGGWHSIWGHEPGQQREGSGTLQALSRARAGAVGAAARAIAVDASGTLPEAAVEGLRAHGLAPVTDLVRYGVVRARQDGEDGR